MYNYTAILQRHLQEILGLVFRDEPTDANLCFLTENTGLRDAFRATFSTQDLIWYCQGCPNGPLPADTDAFWTGVQLGKEGGGVIS